MTLRVRPFFARRAPHTRTSPRYRHAHGITASRAGATATTRRVRLPFCRFRNVVDPGIAERPRHDRYSRTATVAFVRRRASGMRTPPRSSPSCALTGSRAHRSRPPNIISRDTHMTLPLLDRRGPTRPYHLREGGRERESSCAPCRMHAHTMLTTPPRLSTYLCSIAPAFAPRHPTTHAPSPRMAMRAAPPVRIHPSQPRERRGAPCTRATERRPPQWLAAGGGPASGRAMRSGTVLPL